jgi:hypothetical protein
MRGRNATVESGYLIRNRKADVLLIASGRMGVDKVQDEGEQC